MRTTKGSPMAETVGDRVDQIRLERALFRSYANRARWYAQTYQDERARDMHCKALATLAMLQWDIAMAAKNRIPPDVG